MIQVTYFPNIAITKPAGISTINLLLETIRVGGINGKLKRDVEEIRRYPYDKDMRTELKRRNLPVITWQGVFSERKNANLLMLSGIMCIDVDHRTIDEIYQLKTSLAKETWCLASFLSPSGDGLKVLVLTDNYNIGAYHSCYCQLEDYFRRNYGTEPDSNCEPLSQGCFASYDPDIYVNLNATPFHLEYHPSYDKIKSCSSVKVTSSVGYHISPPTFIQRFQNSLNTAINDMTDEQIIDILDRRFRRYKQNYVDGNRTRSVFAQAVVLCKAGIPQDRANEYLMSRFLPTGFLKEKVIRETGNAYYKNRVYFGIERGQYLSYPNYRKLK